MSNRKWREQTIAELARRGVTYEDSCKLLRASATLHRLAEAQCNGDWPYNGDRDAPLPSSLSRARWNRWYAVCPECQASGVAVSSMRRAGGKGEPVCPDCRASARVREMVEGWVKAGRYPGLRGVRLQGDPRGCVMTVEFDSMAGRPFGTPNEVGIAG